MKFFDISEPRSFCERVISCHGPIQEIKPGNRVSDFKRMAGYLIVSGLADQMKAIPEIDLRIQDPQDAAILLNYAMQMGRERICS